MDGDTSIGRRKLLVGAGAGLGALALASVPSVASADPQKKSKGGLTGSWLLNATFISNNQIPAPPPSTVVNSFADGGVFSLIVLGPNGSFPGLGTWESTGDHSFRVTLWQSVPDEPVVGTLAVRAVQTGSFSGDQMETTATYEVFIASDLPKLNMLTSGTTTSSGMRISA